MLKVNFFKKIDNIFLERVMILESLWKKVKPNGYFILSEPGTPKGSRFVHDFREYMREKYSESSTIISPCAHQLDCPLASKENTWCHF